MFIDNNQYILHTIHPSPPGWVKEVVLIDDTKSDGLKRLNYIEGHLSGIKRMLEGDKYCVDILKQTYAVRRAIEKLETKLLDSHLNSCVVSGVKEGREEQVIGELIELYGLNTK